MSKKEDSSDDTMAAEQPDKLVRLIRYLRCVPGIGIFMGALSGAFAATGGFIVKLIPEIHPVEVVVWRSALRLVVYIAVILGARMSIKGAEGERIYLVLRAIIGFMATASAYTSYRLVPLADASAIIFSAPVFVSIFARILLNEACGIPQILNILLTVIGVMLIAKPTFIFGSIDDGLDTTYQLEGTCAALFASLCFALAFVLMRKLQKTPSEVVIFWFAMSSVALGVGVVSAQTIFYDYKPRLPNTAKEISLLFVSGMVGVISQPLLTVALKIEEAGLVSLARTVDVAMAFFFQIFFLGESVHWTSLLGAIIICCGVVIAILRKWHSERPDALRSCICCLGSSSEVDERTVLRSPETVTYSGLKDEFP